MRVRVRVRVRAGVRCDYDYEVHFRKKRQQNDLIGLKYQFIVDTF